MLLPSVDILLPFVDILLPFVDILLPYVDKFFLPLFVTDYYEVKVN